MVIAQYEQAVAVIQGSQQEAKELGGFKSEDLKFPRKLKEDVLMANAIDLERDGIFDLNAAMTKPNNQQKVYGYLANTATVIVQRLFRENGIAVPEGQPETPANARMQTEVAGNVQMKALLAQQVNGDIWLVHAIEKQMVAGVVTGSPEAKSIFNTVKDKLDIVESGEKAVIDGVKAEHGLKPATPRSENKLPGLTRSGATVAGEAYIAK